MQAQRPPGRQPSTLTAIALAAAVVAGGFALFGGYIEAFLPVKDAPTVADTRPGLAEQPEVPEKGWYNEARHGAEVTYWGRTYEVVGERVTLPENLVSAAGDSEEDVVLYFRNDFSAAAKLPATYPEGGRVGGAGEWNRDASEHQGGGAGAAAYPDDKGPLYVRVGPDAYRMIRPVGRPEGVSDAE